MSECVCDHSFKVSGGYWTGLPLAASVLSVSLLFLSPLPLFFFISLFSSLPYPYTFLPLFSHVALLLGHRCVALRSSFYLFNPASFSRLEKSTSFQFISLLRSTQLSVYSCCILFIHTLDSVQQSFINRSDTCILLLYFTTTTYSQLNERTNETNPSGSSQFSYQLRPFGEKYLCHDECLVICVCVFKSLKINSNSYFLYTGAFC